MIGNILNELFEDILENPAHNNREYLREKAEKIFSKICKISETVGE